MKKLYLLLISLLIGVALFCWVIGTVDWREIKNAFLSFTAFQGMAIIGITILMALAGTWKWKEVLKGMDIKIPFGAFWRAYLASFSIRYLIPISIMGEEILQGYILKEKNQVPWSKGMASVIIDRVLEWTINLAVVFLGLLFFSLTISFPPIKLSIILGTVFFIFAVIIAFFYFRSFRKESIAKFFIRGSKSQLLEIEKEIFNFFNPKNILMWKAFGLNLFRAVIVFIRSWLLIIFLGKNIGALPVLSILGFSYLAAMIPIPALIGSYEVIQSFAFNSLGLGASVGIAFSILIRGAELIIALTGIIILFRLGIELFKKNII